MTNNLNSINSIESTTDSRKSSKFVENTKKAVRDVLIKTWIVASTMVPMSATASTTTMPTCVNTTTQIVPSNNYSESEIESELPEIDITWWEIINTEWKSWYSSETRADNQNNNIEYKAMEINNIRPVDILPIIGQIETGDTQCYEHIEHLRLAEATRIRDMMRKYGAGKHSPEEYQELMNRLNTGMVNEYPKWYNNFEIIGQWTFWDEWIDHSHIERSILNALIQHSNFKVVFTSWDQRQNKLETFIKDNTNAITILWSSAYAETNKENFLQRTENDKVRELCKSKKLIIFKSGWNIYEEYWILKNKSYQRDINWDEHWIYSLQANANWKNDEDANITLLVTVGTDKNWDIDQTNEIYASSMFPVWFHNKVLFSGRAFPYHSLNSWKIEAEGLVNNWKYATSYTNYVNVAMTDLCFQMFAEVKDVDELLEMIRSTSLTDHIRFNWEDQPLQLINPAWYFQKYLMPTDLPTSLKTDETIDLEKGYYHGVIYQIPGAEVNINGQWVAFTDNNKDLILSQNPMNLEWRLNGKLLNSYNYKPGDSINGQIIAVDDQWNGLNMTKDFSVNIEAPSSINSVTMPYTSDTWYTIDGIRLDAKPTKPGIYIINWQKVIIK